MTSGVRRALWVLRMPLLVGVICASSVFSVGMLVTRAGGTAGLGLEPDYYRHALEWDRRKRAEAESAALGWVCETELRAGGGGLVVRLVGADGRGIGGASVSGEAFPYRDASRRAGLRFEAGEGAAGSFLAEIPGGVEPGRWRVSIVAERGAERFVLERDVEVPAP